MNLVRYNKDNSQRITKKQKKKKKEWSLPIEDIQVSQLSISTNYLIILGC